MKTRFKALRRAQKAEMLWERRERKTAAEAVASVREMRRDTSDGMLAWRRRKREQDQAGLLRTEASFARLMELQPTPPPEVVEAGLVEYDGENWKPVR